MDPVAYVFLTACWTFYSFSISKTMISGANSKAELNEMCNAWGLSKEIPNNPWIGDWETSREGQFFAASDGLDSPS